MEKRIDYIDAVKGFAIFFVVFAHALVWNITDASLIITKDLVSDTNIKVGGIIWHAIYSFHMPLFFFVSGYLFRVGKTSKNDISSNVKKKVQRLLLPYFISGWLMLLVRGHYGYWFLLSLFELNASFLLIDVILCKINKRGGVKMDIALLLVVYLPLRLSHFDGMSVCGVELFSFVGYIPSFCMGYLMKKHKCLYSFLLLPSTYSMFLAAFILLFTELSQVNEYSSRCI